ncbi:unnamed protein product [Microthlaspi erraticum]|uniref:Late embryogenesis abundant protein LEA-2 subgroup domain-containing protein n=1 Tax=Microthlaspi erraticum TaxID=1685480 RepID=A0A6D2L928_9BRAS|nr:unnamed protein product [Microthlaspi erraticum]
MAGLGNDSIQQSLRNVTQKDVPRTHRPSIDTNDSCQRSPRNSGVSVTDNAGRRAKHQSIDTNDSYKRSPRNSGGFVIDKAGRRIKHISIDTNDSSSSRYSLESQKPRPPPGDYHIKIPREQIYRIPPPENAHRYEYLFRQKPNRSSFRRCCCSSLAALIVLLVIAALVVGILFLVYRPHKPSYSVSGVSFAGINLTSSSPMSPVIKLKVRSKNVNAKLGLIYGNGTSAELFYDGIKLGGGEFAAFKQPAENVTVTATKLRGSRVQLTSSSRKELTESEKKGKVPFDLRIKAPVKFKAGLVTTWTVTVTVECKITLDKLTASATVITENCVTEDISLF